MLGSLKERRNLKMWAERVDAHVTEILRDREPPIEIDICGTLETRTQLLDLYSSKLARSGLRLASVLRDGDTWSATYDRGVNFTRGSRSPTQ